MLVVSYGIPKSGSTLAYEMLRGVLESAGHEQAILRNDRLDDGDAPRGTKRNFLNKITRESIQALMDEIGKGRIIAVKTHSGFAAELFPWLEEMQQSGAMKVIASYRDPRDVCLSLVDAGNRSRDRGTGAFAGIGGLEEAMDKVDTRITVFRRWAALKGTLRLNYDDVAYNPAKAIDAMEAALGVKANRADVMRYAFEEAYTLRNKVKRNRYLDEMNDDEKRVASERFKKFLRNAIERDNQNWYDKFRTVVLSRLEQGGGDESESDTA